MDRHEDPAPTRNHPRLLDRFRDVIRPLHYRIRTEQAYVDRIRCFILFHGKWGRIYLSGPVWMSSIAPFYTDPKFTFKLIDETRRSCQLSSLWRL